MHAPGVEREGFEALLGVDGAGGGGVLELEGRVCRELLVVGWSRWGESLLGDQWGGVWRCSGMC